MKYKFILFSPWILKSPDKHKHFKRVRIHGLGSRVQGSGFRV